MHTFTELTARVRRDCTALIGAELASLMDAARPLGIAPTVVALEAMMAGGKRFRAALTVAGFAAAKPRADIAPALRAGVALELLHGYLLVQDDWMDGDLQRRGVRSVHVSLAHAYGNEARGAASAMLAGDLLFGRAVTTITALPISATKRIEAVDTMMAFHEQVVMGQQLDVLGSGAIDKVHDLKTASYTVTGPLVLGAVIAGAKHQRRRELAALGACLGGAFQLRDDLLGVQRDVRAGRRTSLTVLMDSMSEAEATEAVQRKLRARCVDARGQLAAMTLPRQPAAWLDGAIAFVEGRP